MQATKMDSTGCIYTFMHVCVTIIIKIDCQFEWEMGGHGRGWRERTRMGGVGKKRGKGKRYNYILIKNIFKNHYQEQY